MQNQKSKTRQHMARLEHWKLEDAKAKFSEVVRRAKSKGPQVVTIRGEEAAVIVSAEEFAAALPQAKQGRQSIVAFLESLPLGDITLAREPDTGRDVAL